MNLIHLRTLVAVADSGSLTHAARDLGFTQPALSRHVTALERETGATLLERHGRGVRLTPAGRTAYDLAREILALEAEMRARCRGLRASGGDWAR